MSHDGSREEDLQPTSDERILSLVRKVLKSLLLRLLDQQCRPDTSQHEERKYLQPA